MRESTGREGARVRGRIALVGALAFIALASGVALVAHASRGRATAPVAITCAGRVRAQLVTVRAPLIPAPGASASGRTPVANGRPSASGRIVSVSVQEGEHVRAGQTLMRLDATMLSLDVAAAQAAAAQAHATATATADALDTIDRGQAKLADTRATLTTTLGELRAQRATLASQLATLRAAMAAGGMRPTAPSGATTTPGPPATTTPSRPATATPGGFAPRGDASALIARLTTALGKLDAGIAKLSAGIARIDAARSGLDTARAQARDARELLSLAADARDIGVTIARSLLARATIVSPAAGVVVFVRPAGSLAMANAPLVRVRPDGPALVDTYLTAAQLREVRVGQAASVRYDSGATTLDATVCAIAARSEIAPTWFPTQVTHMTRATKATLRISSKDQPPAGTPVDVTIRTTSRR